MTEQTAAPFPQKDRFPLFCDVRGKKALVVGGGAVSARRCRTFEPRDLEGAFLAVAATDSRQVNRQVGLLARQAGCFVSVADRAEECTFFFPALIETETLTIGVAGDGRDHAAVARANQGGNWMKLRIGTRDSRLAMIQAQQFIQQLNRVRPDIQTEIVALKTTGDKILDRTLDQVGGKGLFVKELDQALLENQADLTVHCVKDLPAELDPRLPLVAFSPREDPRDVLVLPQGASQPDLSLPVGSAPPGAGKPDQPLFLPPRNAARRRPRHFGRPGPRGFRPVHFSPPARRRVRPPRPSGTGLHPDPGRRLLFPGGRVCPD